MFLFMMLAVLAAQAIDRLMQHKAAPTPVASQAVADTSTMSVEDYAQKICDDYIRTHGGQQW